MAATEGADPNLTPLNQIELNRFECSRYMPATGGTDPNLTPINQIKLN